MHDSAAPSSPLGVDELAPFREARQCCSRCGVLAAFNDGGFHAGGLRRACPASVVWGTVHTTTGSLRRSAPLSPRCAHVFGAASLGSRLADGQLAPSAVNARSTAAEAGGWETKHAGSRASPTHRSRCGPPWWSCVVALLARCRPQLPRLGRSSGGHWRCVAALTLRRRRTVAHTRPRFQRSRPRPGDQVRVAPRCGGQVCCAPRRTAGLSPRRTRRGAQPSPAQPSPACSDSSDLHAPSGRPAPDARTAGTA